MLTLLLSAAIALHTPADLARSTFNKTGFGTEAGWSTIAQVKGAPSTQRPQPPGSAVVNCDPVPIPVVSYFGYAGQLQTSSDGFLAKGDARQAETVWRDGIKKAKAPEDAAAATQGLVDLLVRRKQYSEAIALYAGLMAALPKDGNLNSFMIAYQSKTAGVLILAGDYVKASAVLDDIAARMKAVPPQQLVATEEVLTEFEACHRYSEAENWRRKYLSQMVPILKSQVFGDESDRTRSGLEIKLAENLLLQSKPTGEAKAIVRHAVDGWRSYHNYVNGVPGGAMIDVESIYEGHQYLRAQIAGDWLDDQSGSPEAKGAKSDAFSSAQELMQDQATQAVLLAAANKFAQQQAGLGDLARSRQTLADQWLGIFTSKSTLFASGESDVARKLAELNAQQSKIEKEIARADKVLESRFPKYFAMIHPRYFGIEEAQAIMARDEAFLSIVPSRFGTYLFGVTKEGFVWRRANLSDQKISEMVDRLRQDLDPASGNTNRFDRKTAYQLYAALIEPMNDLIGAKTHLFVAADGQLASLPFGVLVTQPPRAGEDERDPEVLKKTPWFADVHAIIQIPSLQSLSFLRSNGRGSGRAAPGGALAPFAGYGDPGLAGAGQGGQRGGALASNDASHLMGYGATGAGPTLMDVDLIRQLPRLPGSAAELEAIRGELKAQPSALHLRDRMTERGIKADSAAGHLTDIRVLDIATHGLTASQSGPLAEPGLVFTPPQRSSGDDDGYLSASEVARLNLTGTDWVILSACNSASPSGSPVVGGLSGLIRGFFLAGAGELLVSHWEVSVDATPQLVSDMLQRAQKPGISRAQALQAAMHSLRMEAQFSHPSTWAAFSLVGDR